MRRPHTGALLVALGILFVSCNPDSGGSGRPPIKGGPPWDPDSVSRANGNGKHGLDHKLILFDIAPTSGLVSGGTDILLVGFNFHQAGPVTEVFFGSEPALSFDVHSNNEIDAVTPPHPAGLVGITVRNADGEEASLDDIYEFIAPPPACLTLNPTTGPDSGGTQVTITTANFSDDFTVDLPIVFFDTAQATMLGAIDPNTVVVVTPPDPNPIPPPNVHPVDVTVQSASGQQSCIFPLGFTYAAPTGTPCLSVVPNPGPVTGGSNVIITLLGPCFANPTISPEVFFGGIPATNVVANNQYSVTCTTPEGQQPGAVDVEFLDGGPVGGSCRCVVPGGYTYQ